MISRVPITGIKMFPTECRHERKGKLRCSRDLPVDVSAIVADTSTGKSATDRQAKGPLFRAHDFEVQGSLFIFYRCIANPVQITGGGRQCANMATTGALYV